MFKVTGNLGRVLLNKSQALKFTDNLENLFPVILRNYKSAEVRQWTIAAKMYKVVVT